MLFFFHLFAGIVFGLLVGDLVHDRRWIIPCIFGAVLPDLIDKPVGYLFFAGMFGSGRIFMHSLVIAAILLAFGLLVWKCWSHPEVLAAATGILFHQVLDLMWQAPEDWYFPLLGISPSNHGADYALTLLMRDFRSGSEWIFALVILALIIAWLASRYFSSIVSGHRRLWAWVTLGASLAFIVLGGITIGSGVSLSSDGMYRIFRFIRWDEQVQFLIGGMVFLMASVLLWRIHLRLLEEHAAVS